MKLTDSNKLSPEAQMSQMLGGYRLTQMLHVAATLKIADSLATESRSVAYLAQAAACDEASLYRLLRALAAYDVFAEDADGNFGLTPLAQTLRTDKASSLRPFALTCGAPWWWSAYGDLLHSVRTGATAFDHAHGMPFFDYLQANPGAAAIFNANMQAMTDHDAEAIANAYDFSIAQNLVDIGGGHGALASALLDKYARLHISVFDQASVIDGASAKLLNLKRQGRCTLLAGDFFVGIPTDADIYMLKDILHDWSDVQAGRILANCRAAMKPGATLLLVERVIPPGNMSHPGKQVDISMMVLTGGKERTAEEYRRLLAQSGLKMNSISAASTGMSVIEARLT